jgi:hypothetical protein
MYFYRQRDTIVQELFIKGGNARRETYVGTKIDPTKIA